ncbi:MAG: hypothetical protein V1667_03355 [bacterium]
MTIPLTAFLFLYLLFVFICLVFSVIAIYHIMKYGQVNFATFAAVFIYAAGCAAVLFLSYLYLSRIDWSVGLTIMQGGFGIFGVNNF